MTPQEAQAAHRIAALMRAARKKMAFTQVDIAQRLQISQSALSKIESGLLIPSAPQWFEFCQLTRIAPDSLLSGFIEKSTPAEVQNGDLTVGFKIPKSYRRDRGSKILAMRPFVQYFRQVAGDEKVSDYFRHIKMDEDALLDLDTQINLNFCLDLVRTLVSQGSLKTGDFSQLTSSVVQSRTHGVLHRYYDGQQDSIDLLQSLIEHARHYECNFQYRIEEQMKNMISISVRPEPHLAGFKYRQDPVLGDMLCQYKKHYFEKFSQYGGRSGGSLREVECHYHGASACIYELKSA